MKLSFPKLLATFAKHVGLDPVALDATQELVIDNHTIGLTLDGDENVGDLVMFTVLGTPAPDYLVKIAPVLLQANNFWAGTGGATIGLQSETGAIMLCARTPLQDLSAESLAAVLSAYADTATYWTAFVEGTFVQEDTPMASLLNHASRA